MSKVLDSVPQFDQFALKTLDYINKLRIAKVGPEDECPQSFGTWQPIIDDVHYRYCVARAQKGEEEAKKVVDRLLEMYKRRYNNFDILLNSGVTEPNQIANALINTVPPLVPIKGTDKDGYVYDANAVIEPGAGKSVRRWLDNYIAWSKEMSPRGSHFMHELTGLWLLSTVALGRIVYMHGPKLEHTGIYFCLAAESSKFAKTTTVNVGLSLLQKAGLYWTLMPTDNMTPQLFYQLASGYVPEDFDKMSPVSKELKTAQLTYAGQQALYYDELGKSLPSITHANGVNHLFERIFLKWSSKQTQDSYLTKTSGQHVVTDPYLAIMGNMIPSDANRGNLPKGGANPFASGLFARYLFSCPDPSSFSMRPFPEFDEMPIIPERLVKTLQELHVRLGAREAKLVPDTDKNGKETGKYTMERSDLPVCFTRITPEARKGFRDYEQTLRYMVMQEDLIPADIQANYSRFGSTAMRIAALLCWIEPAEGEQLGTLTYEHWCAAQNIAEMARANLHEFYGQANEGEVSEAKHQENKIITVLDKKDKFGKTLFRKAYEISQRTGQSTQRCIEQLEPLVASGVVMKIQVYGGKGRSKILDIYGMPGASIPSNVRPVEDEDEDEGTGTAKTKAK